MEKVKKHRKKKLYLNRSAGGNFAIFFFLAIIGIFMILPMIYVISNSLKPLNELWIFPPRFLVKNPTFSNFKDIFSLMSDSWVPFTKYVYNTLFVALIGTAGHVIIASAAAYALAKHYFPGKEILFKAIVLSLMFSPAVTEVPSFFIMAKLNLIDSHFSLVLPAFCSSMGLYLMKQFMETNIPDALIESAHIDGANEWTVFWKLVMPLVKPAWLTLIIFSFQGLWNIASTPYIRSEGLKTLNYALAQIAAGGVARQGASAAASVIMMILPITVFVVTQSNVIETVASSGMKD